MNRKGINQWEAVITLVIIVVVVLISYQLYHSIFDIGESQFDKRACQLSLELTRATDSNLRFSCFNPINAPIPVRCDRKFITVGPDDVFVGGHSVLPEYDLSCPFVANEPGTDTNARSEYTGQTCLAENVLAKEMANCWDTFFQGEVPVFQQLEKDANGILDTKNYARVCFVCAEVTLRTGYDIEDFRDGYLKNKQYREELTFYQFIAKNPRALCPYSLKEQSPDGTCYRALGNDRGVQLSNIIPEAMRKVLEASPIEQGEFADGQTYAVTFIRQGMYEKCGPNQEEGDEYTPAMTVQVLPTRNIESYCDLVFV